MRIPVDSFTIGTFAVWLLYVTTRLPHLHSFHIVDWVGLPGGVWLLLDSHTVTRFAPSLPIYRCPHLTFPFVIYDSTVYCVTFGYRVCYGSTVGYHGCCCWTWLLPAHTNRPCYGRYSGLTLPHTFHTQRSRLRLVIYVPHTRVPVCPVIYCRSVWLYRSVRYMRHGRLRSRLTRAVTVYHYGCSRLCLPVVTVTRTFIYYVTGCGSHTLWVAVVTLLPARLDLPLMDTHTAIALIGFTRFALIRVTDVTHVGLVTHTRCITFTTFIPHVVPLPTTPVRLVYRLCHLPVMIYFQF